VIAPGIELGTSGSIARNSGYFTKMFQISEILLAAYDVM
jgi:hypothetical protein